MTNGEHDPLRREDAVSERMRTAIRYGCMVGPPIILLVMVFEWIAGHPTSRATTLLRLAMMAASIITVIILGRGGSLRRVLVIATVISVVGLSFVLIRIAETGGANSPHLALYGLTVASTMFVLPFKPRVIFLFYFVAFVVSTLVFVKSTPQLADDTWLMASIKISAMASMLSAVGAYMHQVVVRDTYEGRMALRDESRRAALALERARIARDLHDHVGARLTGIALRAEREQKKLPPEQRMALVWIQDTVRLCLEELRDTIWALSNSGRDARELMATLRRRAEDICDAADIRLSWEASDDDWNGMLSPGVSVAMSAILREALTNTIRHSGAKQVTVTLVRRAEEIELVIEDDGAGLGQTPSQGRGLSNMKQRAEEQKGTVVIEPSGAAGVRVVATIPLRDDKNEGKAT